MLQFIIENRISAVILAAVVAAVVLAVRKIVKDKKAGKGACGNRCSDCPQAAACRERDKRDTEREEWNSIG